MLLFAAIGHFVFIAGMILMLPHFISFVKAVVYLTGVAEIASALGLLINPWCETTATLLLIFFIASLPANIYAAYKQVDYQKARRAAQA